MTAWYRDPQTQLLHRGLRHLGLVQAACYEQFAPLDPEITLPPGESPRARLPGVRGRPPPDKDFPVRMASLAPRWWMDRLGWEGLAVALVTLAVMAGVAILAWPR